MKQCFLLCFFKHEVLNMRSKILGTLVKHVFFFESNKCCITEAFKMWSNTKKNVSFWKRDTIMGKQNFKSTMRRNESFSFFFFFFFFFQRLKKSPSPWFWLGQICQSLGELSSQTPTKNHLLSSSNFNYGPQSDVNERNCFQNHFIYFSHA
jgi:hypothetical protein